MTMGTAAPPRPAASPAQNTAPVAVRPFRYGVQSVDDVPYDNTVTLNASAQVLPVYEIPSTGFLEYVDLLVECTTAANAATVTFSANGPFNVINTFQFVDTNNQPIIGPFSGYMLMLLNKYGGYNFNDDPRNSSAFSATTGAGGTGGSFSFGLRIPLELVPRDGLASLPNKSASTPFKVKITIDASTVPYGTAPTTPGSLRTRMVPKSYWQPQAADMFGNPLAQNPPAVNTTQYWQEADYTLAAGTFNQQLSSSTGFPIRNLGFVLTDSTGSRSQGEADWPDPFRLQLEANIIVDRIAKVWRNNIARDYGYSGAVGDGALGKDNGVYFETWCRDFGPKPGWETRRGYLPTTDTMRLQARGTIGGSGAHTLAVLTNYVAPGSGSNLASIAA